jgi:hypothetical protein
MYKLLDEVESATNILPEVMREVVRRAPGIVPNTSTNIPPMNGSTVLTIATLD